jgi:hypothetical protein
MLRGYFNYYAVPTNWRTIGRFRTEVIRLWRRQLRQRSQRTVLNWARMNRLSLRWLPPRIGGIRLTFRDKADFSKRGWVLDLGCCA